MKQLLIIDPQNDFCDIAGAALSVAGASADLARLTGFMQAVTLDSITVTLDSHASVAVERTTFWTDAKGDALAPFTFVTAADVLAGTLVPRHSAYTPAVVAMLRQLEARGREGLVIWPVHCVTGTWGHNIYAPLADALAAWELQHQRSVRKVLKGEYPLTEHFGVFEADAPDAQVASTQFNTALARNVTHQVDVLFLAGEAGSHCVAASFDQLAAYLQQQATRPRVVLLTDCMSPVPGFEAQQTALLERARAFGADTMTSAQAISTFG
jgi:nicotinamidase-related amidase